VAATTARKATLIFCSGIRHGQHVVREFRERHGIECGFVSGDMPAAERDEAIARFRSGALRYLANVQVLTVGFDAPHIDCVAMLRPTLSPGLYAQMVGRGLRKHEGKDDCLVLDFAGNVLTHGPIDAIRDPRLPQGTGEAPAKECPACHALLHASLANCTECGHAFPPRRVAKHDAVASDAEVLSDGTSRPNRWTAEVMDTSYHIHRKRSDPSSISMRISYRIGFAEWVSEWRCFDHPLGSFARNQAEKWWRARSNEACPVSVEEAVDLADAGALAAVRRITMEHNRKTGWPEVVGYDLGDKPPRLESQDGLPETVPCGAAFPDDDIPF
jgi:DNA repair protein RadD